MRPSDRSLPGPGPTNAQCVCRPAESPPIRGCAAGDALESDANCEVQDMPVTGQSVDKLAGSCRLVKGEPANAPIRWLFVSRKSRRPMLGRARPIYYRYALAVRTRASFPRREGEEGEGRARWVLGRRPTGGGRRNLADTSLPVIERGDADAELPAELGDRQIFRLLPNNSCILHGPGA